MNKVMISGMVSGLPKVSIIPIESKPNVYVCKFVVGVRTDETTDTVSADFFECLAFGNTARMICRNLEKGSTVNLTGKIKNHRFQDVNGTWHFTNVILVSQADNLKGSRIIASDTAEINAQFESLSASGFLCVDEDDYYNLATENDVFSI